MGFSVCTPDLQGVFVQESDALKAGLRTQTNRPSYLWKITPDSTCPL